MTLIVLLLAALLASSADPCLAPADRDARLHCKVRDRVRAWIATPNEPVTLDVRSTIGWGCLCPPLAVGESGDSVRFDEELIYPVFAASPAPPDVLPPGRYRVTGRFDPIPANRFEWARRAGQPRPRASRDRIGPLKKKHPLLQVTAWCLLSSKDPEAKSLPRCKPAKRR